MPAEPNAPGTATAARSGWRFTTVAAGCGIGCLAVVVALIAGGFALLRWATKPSEIPAASALGTADAHLYASVSIDGADSGTAALIAALVAVADDSGLSHAGKAMPIRLTTMAIDEPPRFVAMVSMTRYMNWLRLSFLPAAFFGDSVMASYRGAKVLRVDPGPQVVTIVGGSLLIASDVDVAKFAIDRLRDNDGGSLAPDLEPLWLATAGAPIRVAAVNRAGSLERVLAELLSRGEVASAPAEAITALARRATGVLVTGSLGSPGANQVSGKLRIRMPEPGPADLEAMQALQPLLEQALDPKRGALTSEAALGEGEVVLDFRLDLDLDEVQSERWKIKVGPVEVER